MKKKLVSVLLCAVMVSSMLYGCGSKTEEAPAADAAAEETEEAEAPAEEAAAEETAEAEPAEINMFISMPEYADAINQLIAEYQKENPNVTINYETTQNDYPTLLKAKLNAGECPDIFSSTSGKEIQTYLEYSYNIGSEPISEAMADSVKATMKSGEEVHGFAVKGNYFGVVYNKAIFEELGLEYPQTMSDLEAACEKISAAGYTPFTTGFAEWWVYKHVFQHFLDAAAGDGEVSELVAKFAAGEAHFSDYPEIYDDFFKYVDLVVKYGDAKPLETDLAAEEAALASGKVAMVCGQGAWIEADVLKINPDIQIGFDGYPVNDNADVCKVIAGSDQALRVNKDSEVLDATLAFINWWYTSDYGKAWFKDVAGVIPPVKEAQAPDFEIIKQGDAHVAAEGAGALAVTYSTDSFHQAFGEIMQSYVAGTVDKDEACAQIEQKWVELEGSAQ